MEGERWQGDRGVEGKETPGMYFFFLLGFVVGLIGQDVSAQHQQTQEKQPSTSSLTPSLTPIDNSTPSRRSACRSPCCRYTARLAVTCSTWRGLKSTGTNTDNMRKAPQFPGGFDGWKHPREAFRLSSFIPLSSFRGSIRISGARSLHLPLALFFWFVTLCKCKHCTLLSSWIV